MARKLKCSERRSGRGGAGATFDSKLKSSDSLESDHIFRTKGHGRKIHVEKKNIYIYKLLIDLVDTSGGCGREQFGIRALGF